MKEDKLQSLSGDLNGKVVAPGEALANANDPSQPIALAPGINTRLSLDAKTIEAAVHGVVETDGTQINVVPPCTLSKDKQTAYFDIYPSTTSGLEITQEMVEQALLVKGVKIGVDSEKIVGLIKRAKTLGTKLTKEEVAFGKQAVQGNTGGWIFCFKIADTDPTKLSPKERSQKKQTNQLTFDLVDEGDVLCKQIIAIIPIQGLTVTGEPVPPPVMIDIKTKNITAGSNVALSPDKKSYVSTQPVCGYVDFMNGAVSVTSPIFATQGGLELRLCVHPGGSNGRMLNLEDIQQIVEHMHIEAKMDMEAASSAIDLAKKSGLVQPEALIAVGRQPTPGKDTEFELYFETEKKVGLVRNANGLDFRERELIVECAAGDLLCEHVPFTAGEPGEDVFGNSIPAKPGVDKRLTFGQHVLFQEQNNGFYAAISGVVTMYKGRLEVADMALVEGDVDLETGNIHTEKSATHIKGTVRGGFIVEAGGHVIIDELVEDAVIHAVGNVSIRRGILHSKNGLVLATGSIHAAFAQNGALEAEEDIILESALNCNLWAGSKVIVKSGKGRLIGGLVKAHRSIEVNELGSESGVATLVFVGTGSPKMERLDREIEKLRAELKQLDATMGPSPYQHAITLSKTTYSKRETLAQKRSEAQEKMRILTEQRTELDAGVDKESLGRVIVNGTAYPGVVINMFKKKLVIEKPIRRCVFFFDSDQDRIASLPL